MDESHKDPDTDEGPVPPWHDALVYPLRGQGLGMIVCGTFVLWGITLIASIIPIVGGIVGIAVGLYLCAFLWEVLGASASGQPEMPWWPDISNFFGEIVPAGLSFISGFLLCFAPAIAAGYKWPDEPWLSWLLVVAGCGYFPMAILAGRVMDSTDGFFPSVVLPAIRRVGRDYAATCVCFAAVLLVTLLGGSYFERIPFAGGLLGQMFNLYAMAAMMRIVGLMYVRHAETLGDFRPDEGQSP